MRVRSLLRRLTDRDDGVALPAVIGIGLVITLLVTSAAAIATSGAVKSSTDRDALNAMQAAYAGVADYQSRLTNDNNYWNYGVSTPFSSGSSFSGSNGNPAFGTTATGATGTWATVSGSNGTESYRYEVNNSTFATTGSVQVRVTGRSGQQTRSLVATVRGTGFIDYLYFTDYESSSPALTGEKQNNPSGAACVSMHLNDPGYDPNVACDPVSFISGDVLSGPVRSNDEITTCGAPTFKQEVQSTAADGVYNRISNCPYSGSPKFGQASGTHPQPAHVGTLQLPATNAGMKDAARTDLNTVPGCLYAGPTSITFNADGSMQVISPWTRATQTFQKADGTLGGIINATNGCGTAAQLASSSGARVALSSNLVYVESVQSDPNDPNYWAAGSQPAAPQSGAVMCSTGGRNPVYGNGLKSPLGANYPSSNEYVGAGGPSSTDSPYNCRNGDAFVSGRFHGALTIGADNRIWAVGSITYQDPTNDILGLVGTSSVVVWNPMTSSGTLLQNAAGANFEIDAAIAANKGTFMVQNWAYGPRLGTLTVKGSIAQKWRGAVGTTGGTGFTKAYGYDARLKNMTPPKFLQPVATTYSVSQQVEVSAAYNAAGTRIS